MSSFVLDSDPNRLSNLPDPQLPMAPGAAAPPLPAIEALASRLAEARRLCAEYQATLAALLAAFYAEPPIQVLLTHLQDAPARAKSASVFTRKPQGCSDVRVGQFL